MGTKSGRSRPAAGARASRPPRRPRTAFVLSGRRQPGRQPGRHAPRRCSSASIVPDVVIGTSAGALNGAGDLPTRRTSPASRSSRRSGSSCAADHVFPGGQIHRAWNVVRRGTHLFGNEGLAALIHHSTPARSFSDLEIPLRVIATDLDTGEEVVLARGPLKPALLASTALPGVFPIVAPRRPAPRRRRRRQQRAALARALGPGRPRLRAQRLVGHVGAASSARRSTS